MIVDRDDYVTKEEYQEKLVIYNDIQRIINEIKDVNSYMEKHKSGHTYHWREAICSLFKSDNYLGFNIYGQNEIRRYISTSNLDMFGIKEEMKIIAEKNFYKYTMYNDLDKLSKVENVYNDLVEYIEKYKDKIISIQQFDNKEKFKDIYDTIKNLEEKYENTRKN